MKKIWTQDYLAIVMLQDCPKFLGSQVTCGGQRVKGVFIPNVLHKPLGSCSLINLNFLLLQIARFVKSMIFPFSVSTTAGFFK